jgi:glycosyltransferase involved in cell wall biosynthesis
MACGLPIIISDASGANERVSGNLTGLTYRESDTEDLRNKMEMLLEPSRRLEMAENSRRAAELWDWRGINRQFEALYMKGVGRR